MSFDPFKMGYPVPTPCAPAPDVVASTGSWPNNHAPVQNVPLTSSDERMHEMSENCWCGPMILAFGQGDDFTIKEVDHQGQIKVGDRVAVDDPALAKLAEIMRDAAGEEPPPNNEGVVDEVRGDGTLIINFDDGGAAPYPASETRRIA